MAKSIDAYLTKEKMIWISAGMEEIHRVLARPAGHNIEDVDSGRPAFRASILRDKLLAGVILEKGELFETMAGYRDEELGIHRSPNTTSRAKHRTTCKDCRVDIRSKSSRLKSDMARCIDCARKKKRQYNQSARGRP